MKLEGLDKTVELMKWVYYENIIEVVYDIFCNA